MDIEKTLYPDKDIIPPPETEPETPPDMGDEPESGDEQENSCIHSWLYQSIPNFYNRVRGALNVSSLMDDETIDFFENAPMAELNVKKRVPNYEELDGTKKMMFETCIIYMTCYAMCPIASTMRITRQKDPSLELEFASSKNQENPCDRFLWLVDDLIAQINDEEVTSFLGFKVTKGSGCRTVKPCWPYGPYKPNRPLRED